MQFLIYIFCKIRAFVARNEIIFEISDKIWIVSSIQNSEAIGRTKNRNFYKGNVIRVGKFSHCAGGFRNPTTIDNFKGENTQCQILEHSFDFPKVSERP